jgi:hypothetical protein
MIPAPTERRLARAWVYYASESRAVFQRLFFSQKLC